MKRKEVKRHLKEMTKLFGDLPDYRHEPIRFKYLVKLYSFYLKTYPKSGKSVINNSVKKSDE